MRRELAASGLCTIGILLVCLAQVVSCKKEADQVSVNWLGSPITIDGRFDDWDQVPTSRMHEDHAVLKLANDSQYVCLYYVTDNLDWVRTIKMTGLTLYFNRDGSHDKEFFVRYRNGPRVADLTTPGPALGTTGPDAMNPAMREQLLESERADRTEFTCFVRDWIVEKSIPTDGRQGPEAAYGLHAGRYAYEFRIPLKPSESLYYGLGASPGTMLGMGAAWGGMPRPITDEPAPGSSEFGGTRGQGSTMGDFGDPGSGGFASPPGGGPPPGLPEKEEVWIKSRLAVAARAES